VFERRIEEHTSGNGARYTAHRLPVELVFAEEFANIGDAYRREKQLQGWGRSKREALINGLYNDLPRLSKKLRFRKG
jgi:putative endonuclease